MKNPQVCYSGSSHKTGTDDDQHQAKQYNLTVAESAIAKESKEEQQEQQKIREKKKLAETGLP